MKPFEIIVIIGQMASRILSLAYIASMYMSFTAIVFSTLAEYWSSMSTAPLPPLLLTWISFSCILALSSIAWAFLLTASNFSYSLRFLSVKYALITFSLLFKYRGAFLPLEASKAFCF